MPSSPPSTRSTAFFLGLDIGIDRLQATVLNTDLVVLEEVEVQLDGLLLGVPTRRGVMHLAGGDALVQPVELFIAGLDVLLGKLQARLDLSLIQAISGGAHSTLALLSPTYSTLLPSLFPHLPLFPQFFPSLNNNDSRQHQQQPPTTTPPFSTTTFQISPPSSVLPHLRELQSITSSSSFPPPSFSSSSFQLMSLDWTRADKARSLGWLIGSLLTGEAGEGWKEGRGEAEGRSGMWNAGGGWDEDVCEYLAGGQGKGKALIGKLGEVGTGRAEEDGGRVSRYMRERYGFSSECLIHPFLPDQQATYLASHPSSSDILISFGLNQLDTLFIPLPSPRSSSTSLDARYQVFPHPVPSPAGSDEGQQWIATIQSRNGEVARELIRRSYTNFSWSVFNQIVSVIPPGGSIGYDDNLFSFVNPLAGLTPLGLTPSTIIRLEGGVLVAEYKDLRANPRCLIESQLLSFRTKHASIANSLQQDGNVGADGKRRTALGLGFDPFESGKGVVPKRVVVCGEMLNSPVSMGILSNIFNAPVYVNSVLAIRSNPISPAQAALPSSVALGAAYQAVYIYLSPPESFPSFISTVLSSPILHQQSASRTPPPLPPSTFSISSASSLSSTTNKLLCARRSRSSSSLSKAYTVPPSTSHSTSPPPPSPSTGYPNPLGPPQLKHQPRSFGAPLATVPEPSAESEHEHDVALETIKPTSNRSRSRTSSTLTFLSPTSSSFISSSTATSVLSSPSTLVSSNAAHAVLNADDGRKTGASGWLQLATPDRDAFNTYGSMIPEFLRLEELFNRGLLVGKRA